MPDLNDGETFEMKGSAAAPYQLRNTGGVYSCTCPAWRNQSVAIERRTCKHLKKLRGADAEAARLGAPAPPAVETPGEETKAPPLLLAQSWTPELDLAGWWMSEKLDGVRALWDGKAFTSRLGNRYHAPPWFVAGLPDMPLDGELWVGRKQFQRTVGIVRRQDQSELWREVRFVVFDAPAIERPFEERVQAIHETLRSEFAVPCAQERCRDSAHLVAELDRLTALGAEGLMMRQPGSRYEAGRSSTLVKMKRFLDAEARVVGHLEGAGRHLGRLGALLVELPNGKRFSIGTGFSDAERERPPAVGSLVTFRYQELSDGGVPRFPSWVGVREEAASPPVGARRTDGDLLREAVKLKELPRAGWKRATAESVAAHSWGVALAALLRCPPDLDREKVLVMAILHDLAEVRVGDLTPADGVPRDEKLRRERAAMAGLVAHRPEFLAVWEEAEAGQTAEARFVKRMDTLDMGVQAERYAELGFDVREFLEVTAAVRRELG